MARNKLNSTFLQYLETLKAFLDRGQDYKVLIATGWWDRNLETIQYMQQELGEKIERVGDNALYDFGLRVGNQVWYIFQNRVYKVDDETGRAYLATAAEKRSEEKQPEVNLENSGQKDDDNLGEDQSSMATNKPERSIPDAHAEIEPGWVGEVEQPAGSEEVGDAVAKGERDNAEFRGSRASDAPNTANKRTRNDRKS